jgi:tetratricopeptide (TPR) repeat protein
LINSISPSPSQDPMARQWYIATTAYMQHRRLYVYARENLKSALEIFPSDDKFLFYTGALHEALSLSLMQNILLPQGGKVSYGSKKSELDQARKYFLKAIEINPGFAESHIHLGRVSGCLGYHSQAAEELQHAASLTNDPQLLYYTSLYLGYEFAMLSRRDEARDQYERAATLFPAAQSPLLALSELADSKGDDEGSLLALQRVFALPSRNSKNDDPLWVYDLAHVRDALALLGELLSTFGKLPR